MKKDITARKTSQVKVKKEKPAERSLVRRKEDGAIEKAREEENKMPSYIPDGWVPKKNPETVRTTQSPVVTVRPSVAPATQLGADRSNIFRPME